MCRKQTKQTQSKNDPKIYLKRERCDHTDHISLAETFTLFYKEFYTPLEDGYFKNIIQSAIIALK